jgi:hypothetical protein
VRRKERVVGENMIEIHVCMYEKVIIRPIKICKKFKKRGRVEGQEIRKSNRGH